MLNLSTEFGSRVNKRLMTDGVIWFTTVSPKGIPHPNPVWFIWDGEFIIVYSKPDSYRVRNIMQNPRVALNLEGADALGNNVIVIYGQALLYPDCEVLYPGFLEKYLQYEAALQTSVDEMIAAYSVEIRVRPERIRGE